MGPAKTRLSYNFMRLSYNNYNPVVTAISQTIGVQTYKKIKFYFKHYKLFFKVASLVGASHI